MRSRWVTFALCIWVTICVAHSDASSMRAVTAAVTAAVPVPIPAVDSGNCFNARGLDLANSLEAASGDGTANSVFARGALYRRLLISIQCVSTLVTAHINDNQFSALVCAVSNSTVRDAHFTHSCSHALMHALTDRE